MTDDATDSRTVTPTALLMVDCQNSFLHHNGGNFWPAAEQLIDPMLRLIQAARQQPTLIVHIADRHRPGVTDAEFNRLPRHCVNGEFDAAFYHGFGPAADTATSREAGLEVVVEKRRYSGFFGTDLQMVLHEHRITRTLIAGVKTNVCVRATATDAFGFGFDVAVVAEAVGSNRENLHHASLEDIDRYIGQVISVDAAFDRLASGSPR